MSTQPQFQYALEIQRVSDAARFGRRPVPPSQLESARAQVRFSALRQGTIPPDASAVDVREQPVFGGERENEISSLVLSVGEDGTVISREFGLDLFESFGDSTARELLKAQQLAGDDKIRYCLFADPLPNGANQTGVTASIRQQAVPLSSGHLDDLLPFAEPVGNIEQDDYPIFVLEALLEQARSTSWKGRDLEGGAWLVGNLFRQTAPRPEIFCLIHTAIEAKGAQHERFSLDLSAESYAHLKSQLDRRRKRLGRTGELAVGFYHTHPFLPSVIDGKESCPSCPIRSTCNLSSSYLSSTDARFHFARFGRAAYAVEMVLGLSPREEFDLNMFCLDGGHFRSRGYYRLAEAPAGLLPEGR